MCNAWRMWLICAGPTCFVQPKYTLEFLLVSKIAQCQCSMSVFGDMLGSCCPLRHYGGNIWCNKVAKRVDQGHYECCATTNAPKTCHERCSYYKRQICWQWQWIVTELLSVSVFCLVTKLLRKCILWLHKTCRTCANKPNASSIAAQTLPPWLELCIAALLKAHSRFESWNVSCHCISEKVRFLGYVFTI